MKVAVTGASGFVGRHVLRELSSRPDIEVTAASRNGQFKAPVPAGAKLVQIDVGSSSPDNFDLLGRPDALIHLAWSGLPNYRSLHHFESELPRQYAFLRSLVDAGLPHLFVAGTCYEYGMRCGELHESLDAQPANPYAHAKNCLRQQLEYLRAQKTFELTWGRLFYMYGSGQAPTSLYPQLMAAIERGDTSFKMSGGEQLRDYLPIEEVARLIVDLSIRRAGVGIVNICSGQPVSVRTLVEQVLAHHGSTMLLDLGHYPYPDYEPMAFWGSDANLQRLIRQQNNNDSTASCDVTG